MFQETLNGLATMSNTQVFLLCPLNNTQESFSNMAVRSDQGQALKRGDSELT